jgi:hypothetical protein
MACLSRQHLLSPSQREQVESGKRSFCHYCEHSVFADYNDARLGHVHSQFMECMITEIEHTLIDCSVFDLYEVKEEG